MTVFLVCFAPIASVLYIFLWLQIENGKLYKQDFISQMRHLITQINHTLLTINKYPSDFIFYFRNQSNQFEGLILNKMTQNYIGFKIGYHGYSLFYPI